MVHLERSLKHASHKEHWTNSKCEITTQTRSMHWKFFYFTLNKPSLSTLLMDTFSVICTRAHTRAHDGAFIPCSSLFNRLRMRWDGTVPKNWTELCVEIIYCVIVLLRVPFSCKLSAHYTFHRPFHAGFVCWLTVKWLLCSSIGKAFGRFLENISIQWQRNMRQ